MDGKIGGIEDYLVRHRCAVSKPRGGFETALVSMIEGWACYSAAHRLAGGGSIREDHVLGPLWEDIGESLRGLLNGESGRLDCGTLDAFISEVMSIETTHEDEMGDGPEGERS